MRKTLVGLAAGATLTISATSAFADAMSMHGTQTNWNGLYIGAAVGYGIATTDIVGNSWTDERYDVNHWAGNRTAIAADGLSSDGVQGTLTLGYDRQIHSGLLIGVFGDYTFGDLENKIWMGGRTIEYDKGDSNSWFAPSHLRTKIGNGWSIGGRIGLARENTLWYAFAGYTQADLDWRFTVYYEEDDPFGTASGSKKLKGYFLGLGVEQQLFQNVSLKLEYRYTDYDKVNFGSYDDGVNDYYHASEFRADTDVHSVRLGVNWKVDLFGGQRAPAYDTLK